MDADRETLERPHRKAVPREMAQSPRPQHQQIAMDRRRGPPPGPGTRSVWQSVGKNCQTSTWQVHRPIPLHSTPHCDFFTIAVSLFQQSGCNSARSFFFFFLAIYLFIPLFSFFSFFSFVHSIDYFETLVGMLKYRNLMFFSHLKYRVMLQLRSFGPKNSIIQQSKFWFVQIDSRTIEI